MLWFAAAGLIVAGVALFVAAPFGGSFSWTRKTPKEFELERLEHERALAVQGLRELEFDREMGKLSDADYQSLRAGLETRALDAMAAIDKASAEERRAQPARLVPQARRDEPSVPAAPSIPRAPVTPIANARNIHYCAQCGTRTARDAKFCLECGTPVRGAGRATGWSD
ncbi:MAG TPA: c-type cytochrome biogenesis protein CcmI [Candidatus Binataceae bacterium]|nr:c-type cytochrome biogenesis protein CcmI [Candidatus Binataceae bacterium]